MKQNSKVLISNLNPGTVRLEFLRSLLSLIVHDANTNRNVCAVVPRYAGPLMGVYRNMAVDHFLAQQADWLFFVDSDIELRDDTLDRLLEIADPTERPVVSGLYMMALDEGLRPSIFHRKENPEKGVINMVSDETFPEDELVDVDGCGCGCLLIHRGILEAMIRVYGQPQPWFAEQVWDGCIYGEDFTFCMRVKQMGYPVYVHTGIDVGHVKTVVLSKEMAKNFDTVPHVTETAAV